MFCYSLGRVRLYVAPFSVCRQHPQSRVAGTTSFQELYDTTYSISIHVYMYSTTYNYKYYAKARGPGPGLRCEVSEFDLRRARSIRNTECCSRSSTGTRTPVPVLSRTRPRCIIEFCYQYQSATMHVTLLEKVC